MTARTEDNKEIIVDVISPNDVKNKTDSEINEKGAIYWHSKFMTTFKAACYWHNRQQTEHQAYISLNGIVEELRNEFNGLLKKKNVDVEKMVVEEEASDYAAHRDIQEVVNEHKKRDIFKITMPFVILSLGLFFGIGIVFNPDFRMFVNNNMPMIAFIVIIAVVALIITTKNRKK